MVPMSDVNYVRQDDELLRTVAFTWCICTMGVVRPVYRGASLKQYLEPFGTGLSRCE